MTVNDEERTEESADRTSGNWPGVGRRPLLKALGAGTVLSAGSGVATASGDNEEDDKDDDGDEDQVDQPEGFKAEVVAPHATFSDDVGAAFAVVYEDGPKELEFLLDVSTVVIARGTLEPGGTTGWHIDRGPALVNVVEGEIDITFEGECVTRTYAAGEAFFATGKRADLVENASDTEQAMAYITFYGVPDGEPPSDPVEPPDC